MDDTQQPDRPNGARERSGTTAGPNILWDDSNMGTTYANVVNGFSSQEEVTLFFGTNQTWNPQRGGDLKVLLHQRIILSPHAAKRLSLLLNAIIQEYERRFGDLRIEQRARGE